MRRFLFLLLLASGLASVVEPLPAQAPARQGYTQPPRLTNPDEVRQRLAALYPAELQQLGIGGRTELRLHLDASGAVTGSRVERTSGFVALDSAALLLVADLRFAPARNGNAPVPLIITFPIGFTPAVPPEHRPGEAASGPSLLNERELRNRLGALCDRGTRAGRTRVKLLVGTDGMVKTVEFLEPSGWRGLDRMALEMVAATRYSPAVGRSGTPVGSWVEYTIECGP